MKQMLTVCAILVLAGSAWAQPGGAGGRQRQGGDRRQGGMRMPGMRMMDRPLTLSGTPGPTLKAVLKLTDAQEKKVSAIQRKAGDDMRGVFPRMERGQRPDQKAIEAVMPKVEARMKKADAEISAVLTPDQRKKAPGLLREMQALRGAALPMSLAGKLKLTPAQLTKLDAVSKARAAKQRKAFDSMGQSGDPAMAMQQMGAIRDNARKQALGALTGPQRAAVEKWEKEHPRNAFGGFGGRMGGPGGPGGRMGAPGGPGGRMGAPGGPGGGAAGRRNPGR